MGDGDGTVNVRSLAACSKWTHEQSQPVYVQAFPKRDHMAVLYVNLVPTANIFSLNFLLNSFVFYSIQDPVILDYIQRVVTLANKANEVPDS